MFLRTRRRLVVICLVVVLPLMTLLVAEGLAQMRLLKPDTTYLRSGRTDRAPRANSGD